MEGVEVLKSFCVRQRKQDHELPEITIEELIQRLTCKDRTVFTELASLQLQKRQMMKMMMFQITVRESEVPSSQASSAFPLLTWSSSWTRERERLLTLLRGSSKDTWCLLSDGRFMYEQESCLIFVTFSCMMSAFHGRRRRGSKRADNFSFSLFWTCLKGKEKAKVT